MSRARELFSVPRGHIALTSVNSGLTPAIALSQESTPLFDAPHDVERWDVRFRHGDVAIEQLERVASENGEEVPAPESSRPPTVDERSVVLALLRGDQVLPMSADLEPREGDVAAVALYIPEREEALLALAERGWRTPETSDPTDADDA